ncbi:HIRAN domain-containing protein [Rosistilla oblonga]|uniref:HIRAN domain-containing protein n=1 Tax=Rosistilla oblonga TaxID=2527990 RepID=UPI003A9822C3
MTPPNQTVFVAWHAEQPMPRWAAVARLDCLYSELGDRRFRFSYTEGARTIEGFRPLDGMEDLHQVYESTSLFPVFKNRLLPASRPEFRQFLEWNGFDPDDPPEPLLLLGRSEGIRKTDAIEVFPKPMPDSHGCFVNFFFVHGIRFQPTAAERISHLHPGDSLTVRREPENPIDPHAIALEANGSMLGYTPRYLARDIERLLSQCPAETVRVTVQQVNLDAPLQQRLLCRMNACWPAGFQPCDTVDYQPISSLVPR